MKSGKNESAAVSERARRGFSGIETWVFDLDNTLYPHHLNLWQQVDARIRDYVADFLHVSHDEAFRLQKDYYRRYGTTMRGLMAEHGLKPDEFLEIVHQIDHSALTPNPALGAAIAALARRQLILTNRNPPPAHPNQRPARPRRCGDEPARNRRAFRGRVRYPRRRVRAEAAAAGLCALPRSSQRRSETRRDIRRSRPQSARAARARHDHRAGGAERRRRCAARRLGARRPRRAARRSCHR